MALWPFFRLRREAQTAGHTFNQNDMME